MSGGDIKPTQALQAEADVLVEARERCARRVRARGQHAEGDRYIAGANDQAWAMRFEVGLIAQERARAATEDNGDHL